MGENGACLDVSASGFWGGQQGTEGIFDVKVFNANAPSYCGTQAFSLYRCFECEKQHNYELRSTMEMRWVLLPHLYFQHFVVLIVLLLYFTEHFLSFFLQKESCDVMAVLQD